MSDASTTWVRRLPWWDILFILVPAIGIASTVFFVAATRSAEPWEGGVAIGLTVACAAFWFAYARRHLGPTPRGYVSFAIITVLMLAAMVLVPVLGILQALLYPYMWTTFEHVTRSVIVTLVIATTLGVASIIYSGGATASAVIFTQLLSIMLSIGIGLAITTAWNVADERQALLDELTLAQEQVRQLSVQTGMSRERERISRELHDTIAQTLSGLSLLAERAARGARRSRPERSPSDAAADAAMPGFSPADDARVADDALIAQLDQIAELAKAALTETRALITESAPVHDESGTPFEAAFERLAERFRRETGITVDLAIETARDTDAPGSAIAIPRDHQVVLLRCLQEGLSNVRRHARASRADVRLEVRADGVTLTIVDDGAGFDTAAVSGTGFGLPGLRERARLLDGSVDIDTAPGRGTTVVVQLPLPAGPTSPAPDPALASPSAADPTRLPPTSLPPPRALDDAGPTRLPPTSPPPPRALDDAGPTRLPPTSPPPPPALDDAAGTANRGGAERDHSRNGAST